MASIIGRTAFRATRALREAGPSAGTLTNAHKADVKQVKENVLKGGARRDPELIVRLTTSSERFHRGL